MKGFVGCDERFEKQKKYYGKSSVFETEFCIVNMEQCQYAFVWRRITEEMLYEIERKKEPFVLVLPCIIDGKETMNIINDGGAHVYHIIEYLSPHRAPFMIEPELFLQFQLSKAPPEIEHILEEFEKKLGFSEEEIEKRQIIDYHNCVQVNDYANDRNYGPRCLFRIPVPTPPKGSIMLIIYKGDLLCEHNFEFSNGYETRLEGYEEGFCFRSYQYTFISHHEIPQGTTIKHFIIHAPLNCFYEVRNIYDVYIILIKERVKKIKT